MPTIRIEPAWESGSSNLTTRAFGHAYFRENCRFGIIYFEKSIVRAEMCMGVYIILELCVASALTPNVTHVGAYLKALL